MLPLKILAVVHLAGLLLLASVGSSSAPPAHDPQPPKRTARTEQGPPSDGRAWFRRMKQYCNPVEAGVMVSRRPPPEGAEGAGYAAACFALAGKMKEADATLAGVASSRDRGVGAQILFQVGHPVADAGDDDSAGPIMRLSLKYLPEQVPAYYMALYHAGVSEYNMRDYALAREHLQRFLGIYRRNDMWTSNAKRVLAKIDVAAGGKVFSGHGRIE